MSFGQLMILCVFVIAGAKQKQTKYDLTIYTGSDEWAGTQANIFIKLFGENGDSRLIKIPENPDNYAQSMKSNVTVEAGKDLGEIQRIRIGHDNTGISPGWFLKKVEVKHVSSYKTSTFIVGRWLMKDPKYSTAVFVDRQEKEQCGQTNVPIIKTVEEATPNQWPWLAHIQSQNTECGGTLVHPKWVVTSAQCVGQNTPSSYTITLGEHDLTSDDYTEQVFKGKKIVVHPEYYPFSIESEVALLELDRSATLDSFVNIACLPSVKDNVSDDQQCYLAGWGSGKRKKRTSIYLQNLELKKIPEEICYKMMENESESFDVTSNMFCANIKGLSECIGDLGSPLVCNKHNVFYLQGALSWIHPKCSDNFNIFAKISKFSGWIETNIYSEYV